MKCPWCKEEMTLVSGYSVIETGAYQLGDDGKYYETTFDESDPGEQEFNCGNCGRALSDGFVQEAFWPAVVMA